MNICQQEVLRGKCKKRRGEQIRRWLQFQQASQEGVTEQVTSGKGLWEARAESSDSKGRNVLGRGAVSAGALRCKCQDFSRDSKWPVWLEQREQAGESWGQATGAGGGHALQLLVIGVYTSGPEQPGEGGGLGSRAPELFIAEAPCLSLLPLMFLVALKLQSPSTRAGPSTPPSQGDIR